MTAALTVRDLQDRVARGVVWLDAKIPNWWRADRPDHGENGGPIHVDALVMSHNCYCVLGQLLGNYYRAEISIEQAVEFGFDSSVGSLARDVSEVDEAMADEFDALRELWIRVLEERRAGVSTP
ncbi:hypothetical protein [Micromonospora sp. WMMD998]|uniref:hypothetical protein n=1 Tax=Micromonospora sp. WMMD998 TaxID=3016092 RepID=UPI00249BD84D|nr:hypothetical protein [Micromonospora sp. WMMD998]WFE41929.1 hypothetical protein O7619_27175 [Micromonospora sp. WMMD998]